MNDSHESRPTEPLLDLHKVAMVLGVSHRTVQRLVESGELASVLIARKRRVEPSAIEDYWQRKHDEAEQERASRARRRLRRRNRRQLYVI